MSHRLVFSDLDGTLIDHETYRFDAAIETIGRARELGVPIVLCSSKTKAEIVHYRNQLRIRDPFICENGGAVFIPHGYFAEADPQTDSPEEPYTIIELGAPYDTLVREFQSLRHEFQLPLRGFHELAPEELSIAAGLTTDQARRALMRGYDEPFWYTGEKRDDKGFQKAVAHKGLRISKGGRYFHLHGDNDKGKAVDILLDFFKKRQTRLLCAAVGDSPNDIPMLSRVDFPYLVQKADGEHDPEVLQGVSRLILVHATGPRGWAVAMNGFLA